MDDQIAEAHLLYNQDPGFLFSETEEPIEPEHVDGMVDEIADAGIDVFFINSNMWCTNHPSEAWEPWWEGYQTWAEHHPPLDTNGMAKTLHWHHPRHPKRYQMIEQMERLAANGCDYLQRGLERCLERGVKPGVSIRMNDQHLNGWPESPYFSEFYRNHPELRFETGELTGLAGLNYEYEPVRNHFLALIEEIAEDYPTAVLELDFLRHPPFVPDGRSAPGASTMTDFLRSVADICRHNSVSLMPRVPATPGGARELGLDISEWTEADLIDGIIVGTALRVDWQIPVGIVRSAVGDLPLFISIDKVADDPPGLPWRLLPDNESLLRGVAGTYAEQDIDGLYFFNFFGPREEPVNPTEPSFHEVDRLRSPERLRGTEKIYLLTSGENLDARSHSPVQLPLRLDSGLPRSLRFTILSESTAMNYRLLIVFDRQIDPGALTIRVNEQPVGDAKQQMEYDRPGHRGGSSGTAPAVAFQVPADAIHGGENRITLQKNGNSEAMVILVELHVEQPEETTG